MLYMAAVKGLEPKEANVGSDGTDQFLIGDAYWNGIAPREELLKTIVSNYTVSGVTAWYSSLPKLDMADGANFYQAREEKISTLSHLSAVCFGTKWGIGWWGGICIVNWKVGSGDGQG